MNPAPENHNTRPPLSRRPPIPPKPCTLINKYTRTDMSQEQHSSIEKFHHVTKVELANKFVSSKQDFEINNDMINDYDAHTSDSCASNSHINIINVSSNESRFQIQRTKNDLDNLASDSNFKNDARTSSVSNIRLDTDKSPEITQNDNLIDEWSADTGTVEIHEVPYQQRSRRNNYGNNNSLTSSSSDYSTNIRSIVKQQQSPRRNDDESCSTSDADVSTRYEAEDITPKAEITVYDSLLEPTNGAPLCSNNFPSINDNPIIAYENGNKQATNHSQNHDIIRMTDNNVSFDTSNSSRDSGDIINTSGSSKGCVLISENESSNSPHDPSRSPKNMSRSDSERSPCEISEATTVISSTPVKNIGLITDVTDQNGDVNGNQIQDANESTSSLSDEIRKLRSRVSVLTSEMTKTRYVGKDSDEIKPVVKRLQELDTSNRLSSPANQSGSTDGRSSTSNLSEMSKQQSPRFQRSPYSQNLSTSNNSALRSSREHLSRSPYATTNRPGSQIGDNYAPKSLRKTRENASTSHLTYDRYKSNNPHQSPMSRSKQNLSTSTIKLHGSKDMSLLNNSRTLSMLDLPSLKNETSTHDASPNSSQFGSSLSTKVLAEFQFRPMKGEQIEIFHDQEENCFHMEIYGQSVDMRIPTSIVDSYDPYTAVDPPEVDLKLDWVHGYRGRDSRSNLHYLSTGECVYYVASIVVIYNIRANTQRHYLGHTDSVKCLAIHPNKYLASSSQSIAKGGRPQIRIWNTVTLATLRVIEFNGHSDRAICCIAFSRYDHGVTLAVVDESEEHTITLMDWQKEKCWRIAEVNGGRDPILAIDFHPLDGYIVAVGRSAINFWYIEEYKSTRRAGNFQKRDEPRTVICLCFNSSGDTITGDSNGNIVIWGRGNNKPQKIVRHVHQGGVLSVVAMDDGTYLTGGRDRRIIEWDLDFEPTGRDIELPEHCGGIRYISLVSKDQVLIGTLGNSILIGNITDGFDIVMDGYVEAITSLATHPRSTLYLTGGFDNKLRMLDPKTHTTLWTKLITTPATALCYSPNGLEVIVGSTSGKWLVIDMVHKEIIHTAYEGAGTIYCVKYSPDGNYICMGSSDSQTYVYKVDKTQGTFQKIGACAGHTAPVKFIDWSDDSRYFKTQSMNFELQYWIANTCLILRDQKAIADSRWSTHDCTLGHSVIGLWSDCALVDCCDKSNDSELIVSASTNGNLNVFKWPPNYIQCSFLRYNGNVDRFNLIKFLNGDPKFVAVGIKDCIVTEWVVEKQ